MSDLTLLNPDASAAEPHGGVAGTTAPHVGVMQITDTLDAGGLERVAVNLANLLPRDRFRPYLCATRRDGSLTGLVNSDVGRLQLNRRSRFDLRAVERLVDFIRRNDVHILHAHGTSLFIATLASLRSPYPAVVWHDHFGRYAVSGRPAILYRWCVSRAKAVIAVNEPLMEWSRDTLGVPAGRIRYVPNFVCRSGAPDDSPDLPGTANTRLVCVANLRPEKDHPTLIHAMADVVRFFPDVHLLSIGRSPYPDYSRKLEQLVDQLGIADNVHWLGSRQDVDAILRRCTVGVLSSVSEGLPLALLEYGLAGLPVVATRTGQCSEVLDEGRAGALVTPGNPRELSQALIRLLRSDELRKTSADRFQRRVDSAYSAVAAVDRICQTYDEVMVDAVR